MKSIPSYEYDHMIELQKFKEGNHMDNGERVIIPL